jgi:DNA-binding response OmpR family regulator
MGDENRIEVLVVEDEAAIRNGLCDVLAYHGYAPEGVERGDEGLEIALEARHALVLLDVMLPGKDGFEICEAVRAVHPRLPILMLTARGSEADVLRGFEVGADDYVTKPFSIAELIARVEALMRRSGVGEQLEVSADFGFGDWTIERSERVARREDATCNLSQKEIAVLTLLAEAKGRIVSRRVLLCDVWGYPDPERVETRTVDMHIAKLRKKLDYRSDSLIETVRGEGYRYSG